MSSSGSREALSPVSLGPGSVWSSSEGHIPMPRAGEKFDIHEAPHGVEGAHNPLAEAEVARTRNVALKRALLGGAGVALAYVIWYLAKHGARSILPRSASKEDAEEEAAR